MCRTCGARPGRRLAVQRAALVDAEAVLLVDDGDGKAVELDRPPRSARACRPAAAARRWPACRAGRRGGPAGVEPVSSAAWTSSPGISFCSVAKCCSASVSVGAISAAWRARLDRAQHRVQRDHGLARADLAHQQPLHRPVAGEVVVDRRHRAPLVAGRRERQRVAQPARGQRARRRAARPPARPRGAATRRRRSAICSSRNSSNASRRRPPSWSPKCAASSAAAAVREPLQRADPGRQRLEHVAHRRPVLVDERRDLHRRQPLGRRVGRHVLPGRDELAGLGVLVDAEAARWPWYLPVSSSRVPGR